MLWSHLTRDKKEKWAPLGEKGWKRGKKWWERGKKGKRRTQTDPLSCTQEEFLVFNTPNDGGKFIPDNSSCPSTPGHQKPPEFPQIQEPRPAGRSFLVLFWGFFLFFIFLECFPPFSCTILHRSLVHFSVPFKHQPAPLPHLPFPQAVPMPQVRNPILSAEQSLKGCCLHHFPPAIL